MSIPALPARVDAMKNVFPSRDDAGQPSSAGELKFGLAPGLTSSIRCATDHAEKGPSSALATPGAARGPTASRASHPIAIAATAARATIAARILDLDLRIVNLPSSLTRTRRGMRPLDVSSSGLRRKARELAHVRVFKNFPNVFGDTVSLAGSRHTPILGLRWAVKPGGRRT
jgi:hypothetical protein